MKDIKEKKEELRKKEMELNEALATLKALGNNIEKLLTDIKTKPEVREESEDEKIEKKLRDKIYTLASLCLDVTGVYKSSQYESQVERHGASYSVYFSVHNPIECIEMKNVNIRYSYDGKGKTTVTGNLEVNIEVYMKLGSSIEVVIYDGREVEGSPLGLPIITKTLDVISSEETYDSFITLTKEIIDLDLSKYAL